MGEDSIEKPESMADFFDQRAAGYDEHMRGYVFTEATFQQFYQAVSCPIEKTDQPLHILDLGCGTGLEFEALFERAPNARLTGIDLSTNMLRLLRERYAARMDQITLEVGSYLRVPFGQRTYDAVISVMSAHHLLQEAKLRLYRKIHTALKPGGKYIEGDSVIPLDMESQFLEEYQQQAYGLEQAEAGTYHIDIPFSIKTQKALLMEAGFYDFELLWQKDDHEVWNAAVYAVRA